MLWTPGLAPSDPEARALCKVSQHGERVRDGCILPHGPPKHWPDAGHGDGLREVVSQILLKEVVKGQLPLSEERLSGQGVEQCGRSETLFAGLHHHLSFLDHVHELNSNECVLGCLERFKP